MKKEKPKKHTIDADDPRTVPIPAELDTPEFRDAWARFVEYRAAKGKKSALTRYAAELALKKVSPLGPAVAIERIERAIMNGWLALEYASDKAAATSSARPAAPQCGPVRALTKFELDHVRYNATTGAERDADGKLILDQLCRDLTCEHCKPRRGEAAE